MNSVQRFTRVSSVEEALAARFADPSAAWLAGGTLLFAGDGRDTPPAVIDVGMALPRSVAREGGYLSIGAGATFQELAESKALPAFLADAVLSMVNRNTRNRATLGGNLGGDKSCSSLIPILVALGAEAEVANPAQPGSARAPERLELETWLGTHSAANGGEGPRAKELVLRVLLPLKPGTRAAYRRWNRVSCDLSVLGAATAYDLVDGKVRNLRLALGGLGPKARRFPAIEALFEGSSLPAREKIESAVAPLLKPIDDLRASAAFKRLRGAQLVADALLDAAELQDPREAHR
jgi:probable selenate reductase FAD-binding subunit